MLTTEYSSSLCSFHVYININKSPRKVQELERFFHEKSEGNKKVYDYELCKSDIKVDVFDRLPVDLFFVNDETKMDRICRGINPAFIRDEIRNCNFIVTLVGKTHDGDDTIMGVAYVNLNLIRPSRRVQPHYESMFVIVLLCGDQVVKGSGFLIQQFLKSIVYKEYFDRDKHNHPDGDTYYETYYGIYLESVMNEDTIKSYERNGYQAIGRTNNYVWNCATLTEEQIGELAEVYYQNYNINHQGHRAEDAMDWGGSKTRKNRKKKQTRNRKNRKKKQTRNHFLKLFKKDNIMTQSN